MKFNKINPLEDIPWDVQKSMQKHRKLNKKGSMSSKKEHSDSLFLGCEEVEIDEMSEGNSKKYIRSYCK